LVTGYAAGTPISVSPLTTTTYTLIGNVTDANGCTVTGTGTASVTVNPTPTATISALPATLCAGNSSTLTFNLTGTSPFNVSYSDGASSFNLSGISNGHTVLVTPLVTRNYTITAISDASGCIGTPGSNVTITVNQPPTVAELIGTATICSGQSTNLSVNITDGTPPYNFTIANFGPIGGYTTGSAIAVSPATTTSYSILGNVTDANGCFVVGSGLAIVTVNPRPAAAIVSSPGTVCSGGSSTLTFNLTGTAPFNVSYTDGTSTFNLTGISTNHTVVVSPTSTTSYAITNISDATTCTGLPGSSTTVTVNPTPTSAVLSGSGPICPGGTANLFVNITSGTAPFTFNITNFGPVANYISGSPIPVSPATSTSYTLSGTVTDANGCSVAGSGSFLVIVNPTPTASISSSPGTLCSGGSSTLTFTLTGTAPFNVSYSDGTTNFDLTGISSGHTVSISPTATTTYTVTSFSDATSCVGVGGSSATVTVNPSPTSAILSDNSAICAGGTGNILVTITGGVGPYNFTIAGLGLITSYVSGTPIPITPATTTAYSITGLVTDTNGCTVAGSGTATVTVNPLPTASVSGGGIVCFGTPLPNVTFTFTGTAPFNFTWSDGVVLTTVNNHPSSTFTITNAAVGTYSVTALTDQNGCAATSLGTPTSVIENTAIASATLIGDATICNGQSTNLAVTIVGGTSPYSFTIAGLGLVSNYTSGTNIPVTPSSTTTYTISGSITDANGCGATGSGTALVTVNEAPNASVSGSPSPICPSSTYTLTFSLTGTAPFNVSYSDGTTTFNLAGILNGHTVNLNPTVSTTYTITSVTDGTSCPGTISGPAATATVNPSITSAVLSGTATICAGATSNLAVTIVGGTPPYNFTITGFGSVTNYISNTPIPVTPVSTTTYSLSGLVTDANSCTVAGSGNATVAVNPIPPSIAPGTDTWIADVYNDAGNAVIPYQNGVNYLPATYRGYILEADIAGFGSSTYNSSTDAFDLNFENSIPLAGTNVCGSYLNNYSLRFQMQKTFTAGVYTFNLISDDGVRFFVDGVAITLSPANSFSDHSYTPYTSDAVCLTAGVHSLVIEYYENIGVSRLTFDYSSVSVPVASVSINASPGTTVCVGTTVTFTAIPTNGGSAPGYQWIKNGLNVGTNSSSYVDATLITGDVVSVAMTSSLSCVTSTPAVSNLITMTVNPVPLAPIASPISYCQGAIAVPLTATGTSLLWYLAATGGVGSATAPTPSTTTPGVTSFYVSQTVSGCESPRAQLDVAINSLPSAPGVSNVSYCVGDAATALTATGTGLLWYAASTGGTGSSTAPTPSTSSTGTTSFFVSQTVSGCESLRAQLDVTVIGPPDNSLAVSASIPNLCTGGSTTIDIVGTQTGVDYQLFDGASLIGSPVAGGGNISIPTGPLTATTTFSVVATYNPANGCSPPVTLLNTATITVGGTLNAGLTVAPLLGTLCSGGFTFVRILNSEMNVNYQLRNNTGNTAVGAPFAGTGGNIDLPTGVLTTSTSFNVLATNATCSLQLTTIVNIVVLPPPNAALTIAGPSSAICPNTSTNITVANSENGVSYQLRLSPSNTNVGSPVVGTGGTVTLATPILTLNTSFNVLAIVGSCSAQLANTINVSLLPPGDPSCTVTGNCATVVITPLPTPATCTLSNGSIFFSISPATPTVNNTGVKITVTGQSITNGSVARTNLNNPNFSLLPLGLYSYTIEYGDVSCTKTGFVTIDQSGTVGAPIASNIVGPKCAGSATGSIKLDVPGETGNLLQWSLDGITFTNFTAGNTITGIPSGLAPTFQRVISVRRNASDPCFAAVTITIQDANPAITVAPPTITDATCANNDGAIAIGTIAGGVGPYTFRFDSVAYATLPTGSKFSNLTGGTHKFTVIDNVGCEKYFKYVVNFPGFVNTTSPILTQPDCAGQGANGTIAFTILSAGTFTVGYTTDPIAQPTTFVNYGTLNILLQGLSKGDYYVWIKPNTAACATKLAVQTITGSITQVSFAAPQLNCNAGLPEIRITNIKAAAGAMTIQITKKGLVTPDRTIILPTVPAGSLYVIKGNELPSTKGDYTINILQTQGTCTVASSSYDFTYNGVLAVSVQNIKSSYPDLPTGGFDLINFTGGQKPYFVTIRFDSASNPQINPLDFSPRTEEVNEFNNSLQFIKNYKALHAGRYHLTVNEDQGCTLEFDVRVPLDFSFDPNSIPNVFTPNGDGSNETFYIRNIPPDTQVNISNRWGAEVFSSKSYQNNWTGDNYPDGVYFYRISTSGNTFTGWVEIIRGR
jgi:gliding motility-associated-like protein